MATAIRARTSIDLVAEPVRAKLVPDTGRAGRPTAALLAVSDEGPAATTVAAGLTAGVLATGSTTGASTTGASTTGGVTTSGLTTRGSTSGGSTTGGMTTGARPRAG